MSSANTYAALTLLSSVDSDEMEIDRSVASPPMVVGKLPPASAAGVVCTLNDGSLESLSAAHKTLTQYCRIFGYRPDGQESVPVEWQICSQDCGWVKFLKYKLAAFFSAVLGDELPPAPFPGTDYPLSLSGGRLGRFIRLQVSNKLSLERRLEFACGILFLKKGFPRPDEAMLQKARESTYETLTTTHVAEPRTASIPARLGGKVVFTREGIAEEMARTCKEVFRGHIFSVKDHVNPFMPTTRATYVHSRSELGHYGTLLGIDKKTVKPEINPLAAIPSALASLKEKGLIVETKRPVLVRPCIPQDFGGCDECITPEDLYVFPRAGQEDLQTLFHKTYLSELERAREESPDVSLVALPEALKTRVISKGPGSIYFVLKPVQKFLHGILRRHPAFQLIGRTYDKVDYAKIFGQDSGKFLSVDYADATNMLDPLVCEVGWNTICDTVGFSQEIRNLGLLSLTRHFIREPKKGSKKKLPQVWGQLMGSILSFILLCLANASVCRVAKEMGEGRRYDLKGLGLLVNGDDGLMRCEEAVKSCWEAAASVVGLQPSVGKVYFHQEYFNINSQSYLWNGGKPMHVRYCNMGLLKGLKRSGIGRETNVVETEDPYSATVGARHRELIKYCPPKLRRGVHEAFLAENRDVLTRYRVPWYLPEAVGGLGLMSIGDFASEPNFQAGDEVEFVYETKPDGTIYGPSPLDRKIYRAIVNGHLKFRSPGKVTVDPIDVRSVARSSVPTFPSRVQMKTSESTSDPSLDKARGIADLYHAYLHHDQVVETAGGGSSISRAMKLIQRQWGRYQTEVHKYNFSGFQFITESCQVEAGRVVFENTYQPVVQGA